MEIKITKDNINEVLNGGKPVVIDFWATWCGPCRMLLPIVEELAEEYEGRVVIGKCNVDEQNELAAQFQIRNIPTLLYFKNGEMVDRTVGALSKTQLKAKLDTL